VHGQEIKLHGKYVVSGYDTEEIDFVDNDSFYISTFYFGFISHGKGKYEIRNKQLFLYFENTNNNNDSLKAPVISKTDNTDSICSIQIKCFDNNEIPLSGATVVLARKGYSNIVKSTDNLGQVIFNIRKGSIPIFIKTYFFGFYPGQIELKNCSDYAITLFHQLDDRYKETLNRGEIHIYEIKDFNENMILMKAQKPLGYLTKYTKRM
jgi:hypothetical protein